MLLCLTYFNGDVSCGIALYSLCSSILVNPSRATRFNMGSGDFGAPVYSLEIPSIYFGITIGFCILTAIKAAQQTFAIHKRTRSVFNLYTWM
ncbi:hypothetical protein EV126DRAFT_423962 [Verticillium dahliae]|nr:hypothetical protein EV126DRAFT_423962 [Verticillium dahliae]